MTTVATRTGTRCQAVCAANGRRCETSGEHELHDFLGVPHPTPCARDEHPESDEPHGPVVLRLLFDDPYERQTWAEDLCAECVDYVRTWGTGCDVEVREVALP